MKKKHLLCFLSIAFCFFLTSEPNVNLAKMEESDLKRVKNEIAVLNLNGYDNIFANTYPSLIYNVTEVVDKEEVKIVTKTRNGRNSIYVEALIRSFPTRPTLKNLNCYDPSQIQFVRPSIMLQAHLTCSEQVYNLPREINKKDKTIKFPKEYNALFKKDENYEKIFGYNLFVEEGVDKNSSNNKIKQGKQKLFKKYGEISKEYLQKNLFQNPCIIKSEECKYSDTENLVTIYYDQFTDLFAIVDPKKNCIVDLGIATQVKYAEMFAYKSADTIKLQELCLRPEETKSIESRELQIYQDLNNAKAIEILKATYGSIDNPNFIWIENNEFKITEQQATKKIEHAVCFKIKPEAYGFSQDQAKRINKVGIVAYLREGGKLPSLDLTRAYQNAIKDFCEDRNQSERNDKTTFRGEPSITFFNRKTQQVAIFDRKTKIFITAYKLADRNVEEYLRTGNIGEI